MDKVVQVDDSSTKPKQQDQMGSHSINTSNSSSERRRRCRLCLLVAALVIVGLGLLLLILGLTVFKAKRPITTVDSVSLADLDFSVDLAGGLRVHLNATLDAGISVRNPNRVGFTYSHSTAFLRYRDTDVGEVPVPDGEIGPRQTRPLNLTLILMADRLLSNSAFYSDVISRTLPFQTYIRIAGHVRLLIKIRVVTYTTCDLEIDLANRALSHQSCRYRTKL